MRCREESLNVWLVLYIYGWIINLRFAIQMSTSTTKENLLKYSCLLEEACWTSNLHSFRSFFFLFLNCICFWYIKYVCCWTVFTNFGSLLFFNIKHYCAWLPSKPQGTTLAVYSQMLLQVQCFFFFFVSCDLCGWAEDLLGCWITKNLTGVGERMTACVLCSCMVMMCHSLQHCHLLPFKTV